MISHAISKTESRVKTQERSVRGCVNRGQSANLAPRDGLEPPTQ